MPITKHPQLTLRVSIYEKQKFEKLQDLGASVRDIFVALAIFYDQHQAGETFLIKGDGDRVPIPKGLFKIK